MQERIDMQIIHIVLLVPSEGIIAMGNMRATTMPLIIIVEILLNTASTPRWDVLRVESGTMRLWLMLYTVYDIE